MRKIILITALSVSLLIMVKCDNYEFPKSPYPRVENLAITNISETGVTFQANITQLGEQPIMNHGFIWGTSENLSFTNEDKIELGAISDLGEIEANVKSGLYKDETYFVKAFLATSNYFVYGDAISFTSKGSTAPLIKSFSPKEGTWGDTITVRGNFFSALAKNNIVKFGSLNSKVVASNDSLIKCIVPDEISDKTIPIYVTVAGGQTKSNNNFILITPSIENLSPQIATFDDIITIRGSHFSAIKEKNKVKFNEHIAEVTESSSSQLKVKVPTSIREKENTVSVTVNLQSTTANGNFMVTPPLISSISNNKGSIGETIQISGNNFNPTTDGNIALFEERSATILNATKSALTVKILEGVYKQRSFIIEVRVAEQSSLSTESFTLQNIWLEKNVMEPGEERGGAVVFAINGKGYIGLGAKFGFLYKNFWEYDPLANKWTSIGDFPDKVRGAAVSFSIGSYAYVGGGYDPFTIEPLFDFWKFDPLFKSWTRVGDLPVPMVSGSVSISTTLKGYVVRGEETENFWEYDPNSDSWKMMPDYPGVFLPYNIPETGFEISDNLYIYSFDGDTAPNQFYEFDFNTGSWTVKAEIESYSFNSYTGFSVKGYGYLVGSDIRKYDAISNSWIQLTEESRGGSSFVINNKAYMWDSISLWEFDPDFQ